LDDPQKPSTAAAREIDAKYDAFQKSSADCCALCAANRSNGCVMWTYQPGGWMVDRNHKCT
jgi:hypothetical protein